MTALFDPLTSDKSRLDRLAVVLAWFCVLLPLLGLLAPRAVVPLVFVAAICGASIMGTMAVPWKIMDRSISLVLGLLIAWCLIASLWSYQPLDAATRALRIGVLLAVLAYLCALCGHFDATQRRMVGLGLGAGIALTVVVVIVEFTLGFPIFTALKGPVSHVYYASSQLNRGISTLAILVWPLAAYAWLSGQRLAALAAPPAVFALILASESTATMLGLAAGVIAAVLACLGRTAGRLVLAAAVAGTLIASPGIAKLMKQTSLEQADYLPNTVRYRVHVWDIVADHILERPVAGWGFDFSSSIPMPHEASPRGERRPIPSHPHNGPLQILLELGAIGGLLTLGFLFLVGRKIDRLPSAGRICATAMSVTILIIASTAYGMWQSHWLTVIGGAAAIMIAAIPGISSKPLGSASPE